MEEVECFIPPTSKPACIRTAELLSLNSFCLFLSRKVKSTLNMLRVCSQDNNSCDRLMLKSHPKRPAAGV